MDGVLDGTLRCFASIVKALGVDCLQLMPTFKLIFATLVELLPSIGRIGTFGRLAPSPITVKSMMEFIVIGCCAARPTNPTLITSVLDFMLVHLGPQFSDPYVINWLGQLHLIVLAVESVLPLSFIWQLLKGETAFLALRARSDVGVMNQVMLVLRTLLSSKNTAAQRSTYAMVIEDAMRAARRLEADASAGSSGGAALPTTALLVFDTLALGVVAELAGNAASDVRSLDPPLLDLIQTPHPYGLAPESVPESLTLALLSLATQFSQSSQFFVASHGFLSKAARRDCDEFCSIGDRVYTLLNSPPQGQSGLSSLRHEQQQQQEQQHQHTVNGAKSSSPGSGSGSCGGGSSSSCTETVVVMQALGWISKFAAAAQVAKNSTGGFVTGSGRQADSPPGELIAKIVASVISLTAARRRDFRCAAARCLGALLSSGLLAEADGAKVVGACLKCTQDTDRVVQQAFVDVLGHAPVGAIPVPTATSDLFPEETRRRRLATVITPTGMFKGHQFQDAMTMLMGIVHPNAASAGAGAGVAVSNRTGATNGKQSNEWLSRMLNASRVLGNLPRREGEASASSEASEVRNSHAFATFWAAAETAKYCVLARLKTPVGSPKQLFELIDRAIRTFGSTPSPPPPARSSAQNEHHYSEQANALLLFLFHLERHLYNATEGCLSLGGVASLNSRVFFSKKQNSRVCDSWFSGVRQNIIVAARAASSVSSTVWHGLKRLRQLFATLKDAVSKGVTAVDLWDKVSAIERVVVYTVAALCKMRQPVAIAGIASWVRRQTPKEVAQHLDGRRWLGWLGATLWDARGNLERAAVDYEEGLREYAAFTERRTAALTAAGHASPADEVFAADVVVLEFLASQSMRCYAELTNWEGVKKFKQQLEDGSGDTGGIPATPAGFSDMLKSSIDFDQLIDTDMVAALSRFDAKDYPGTREAFKKVNPLGRGDGRTTTCRLLADKSDFHIVSALLVTTAPTASAAAGRVVNRTVRAELQQAKRCIHDLLTMAQNENSSLATHSAVMLMQTANVADVTLGSGRDQMGAAGASSTDASLCMLPAVLDQEIAKLDPSLHNIGGWMRLLRVANFVHEQRGEDALPANVIETLQLTTSRLARKQGNLMLAERLVNASNMPDSKHVVYERSKLTFSQGNYRGAVKQLWETFMNAESVTGLLSGTSAGTMYGASKKGPVDARARLRLAAWFQSDDVSNDAELLASLSGPGLDQGLALLPDVVASAFATMAGAEVASGNNGAAAHRLAGSCLSLASVRTPDHAKAHAHYGAWCYRQGRRMIGRPTSTTAPSLASATAAITTPGTAPGTMPATPSPSSAASTKMVMQITSLVGEWAAQHGNDSATAVNSSVNAVMNLFVDTLLAEDTTILVLDEDGDHSDPQTRLRAVKRSILDELPGVSDEIADGLMSLWSETQAQVLELYTSAANAYFTYLRLDTGTTSVDDNNITATLRLLRLLVRHGIEMQSALTTGFECTPSFAWQRIVPQLFARLSHPSAFVQEQVQTLLSRIARDAPHLIVYPAVVGAEEEVKNGETTAAAGGKFSAIKQSLSQHSPELVEQVHEMISQLKRITVLWDEAWLSMLAHKQADITRRIQRLKIEAARVAQNETLDDAEKQRLILEKHTAIMKPVLVAADDLRRQTYAQAPESSHERQFAEFFGPAIDAAIAELKEPSCMPYDAGAAWKPFKRIAELLKDSSRRKLVLKDISPRLAARQASAISMPGLSTRDPAKLVTIQSFKQDVVILPSKTKPKKIFLVGSDGREYAFLFKGHEDLHLDERIMQFLDIVNVTFSRAAKTRSKFRARNYDVIPIGAESGLIQWVDGTVPAFQLYSKWQHRKAVQTAERESAERAAREQQQQQEKKGNNSKSSSASSAPAASNAKPSKVTTLPRPSESFFKKLTPALKERGITNLVSRSKWPRDVLSQVLQELHAETPSDLISRELWLSSSSPAEWLELTNNFARSMAVMSMIGHILGLGDRHLDNILMDFTTGEVVHIDFNVCFEKGTKLRVPEVVPYRMTANFRRALGVTGVEGMFRTSCEHVLRSLRRNREILLTLLEAFVYDPLVDWTPDDESDQERKAMERNISHTLLASRITELKVPLQINHAKLNGALTSYQEALDQMVGGNRALTTTEQQVQSLEKESNLLDMLTEADCKRVLPELFEVYAREHVLQTHRDVVAAAISKTAHETGAWHEQHLAANEAIRGQHLLLLQNQLLESQSEALAVAADNFSPATEYLMSAGQQKLQRQCQDEHYELSRIAQRRRTAMLSCMSQLQKYSKMAAEYPRSVVFQNRCYLWHEWLQKLVKNPTTEQCEQILRASSPQQPTHHQINACKQMEDVLVSILESRRRAVADLKEACTAEAGTKGAWMVEDRVAESTSVIHQFSTGNAAELDCVTIKLMQQRLEGLRQLESTMGSDGSDADSARGLGGLPKFNTWASMEDGGVAVGNHGVGALNQLLGEADRAIGQVEMLRECYSATGQTGGFDHPDCEMTLVCFSAAQTLFQTLHGLLAGFDNKMLPMIIKALQSDYGRVSSVINQLNGLCDEAVMLHQQLEVSFSTGSDVSSEAVEGIRILRADFADMIGDQGERVTAASAVGGDNNGDGGKQSGAETGGTDANGANGGADGGGAPDAAGPPLNDGQVLLVEFNKLFQEAEQALQDLYAQASNTSYFPFAWSGLAPELPTQATKVAMTADFFFLKQLLAMQAGFLACEEYVYAYTQDYGSVTMPTAEAEAVTEAVSVVPESFGALVDDVGSHDLRLYVAEFCAQRVRHGLSSILSAIIGARLQALGLASKALAAESWGSDGGFGDGARNERGLSAEVLVQKGIALCAANQRVRPERLGQAQRYLENLVSALENAASMRREHAAIATAASIRHWSQLQLARFQWLQGEVLAQHPQGRAPLMPTLRQTVAEIFKGTQELVNLQHAFRSSSDRLAEVENDVLRRVAWGKNANRSLEEVYDAVAVGIGQRHQAVAAETKTCSAIVGVCNAIAHMEMFRARNQETDRFNQANGGQLQAYYEVLRQIDQIKQSVKHFEDQLPPGLKEFAPQGRITINWVNHRRDNIGRHFHTATNEVERLANGQHELQEQLESSSAHLQEAATENNALLAELAPLLQPVIAAGDVTAKAVQQGYHTLPETIRTLAKAGIVYSEADGGPRALELISAARGSDDDSNGAGGGSTADAEKDDAGGADDGADESGADGSGAADGAAVEGTLAPTPSLSVTKEVAAAQAMAVQLLEGEPVIHELSSGLEQLHDQLMALQSATAAVDEEAEGKDEEAQPQTVVSSRQEKNAHAVAVWKRVRAKLDGRAVSSRGGGSSDGGAVQRMSIAEQVDRTIREATSNEHLSVMFEGWTAWI